MQETITVGANNYRDFDFPFNIPQGAKILVETPLVYGNALGVSVGRDINKHFTIRAFNSTSASKDVVVAYTVLYII